MSGGWRKALVFVGAIASIELGTRIGLPGVDAIALLQYFDQAGRPLLVSAFAFIAGGGLFRAGVLALGIMPYLTARIYLRLWRIVRPTQQSPREERVRVRLLTGALAVIQSIGFATFLQRVPGAVANPGVGFLTTTVLTLTAGSLIAMWFGEKLTQNDDSDEIESPAAIGDNSTLRQQISGGNFAHAKETPAARPQPDRVR
jgi:preprotein translocase subunit SecY